MSQDNRTRLIRLTYSLISGVHWGQVLRHETGATKGDPALFGRGQRTLDQVRRLHEAFKTLLAIDTQQVVAWANGQSAERGDKIESLVAQLNLAAFPSALNLPANVLATYMQLRLTGPEEFFVRAVANLGQLNLEIDYDGTLLQDLLRLYQALGVKQLYLPDSDEEQLAVGKMLADRCAAAPYPTDADAWRMVFKKLNNWAEKASGHRDKHVLADEMLKEPQNEALAQKLKKLGARRVAILGHSMTMSLHWSTYGSWCEVACEVAKRLNPGFDYRGFQAGGLTSSRAIKMGLLDEMLKYRPTDTYTLMFVANEEDQQAYDRIVAELLKAGSRVTIVDDVRPWLTLSEMQQNTYRLLAEKHKVQVLDFMSRGRTQEGWEAWEAVDAIHMNTPGHLFYARELLKMWADQAAARRR